MWDEATESARAALNEFGAHYVEGGGEAAFYGPKIDVQIRNVNGKEDTIATVQVDFYSADRFNLEFTNNQGQKEKPVIVHRAIMGSFERFFAFLIEQYAGAFPTWLSPVQVMILPVSDKHNTYAKEIARVLLGAGIQILLDDSKDTLGKKVRSAKGSKAPYFIVIGDKEVELGTVTIENRNGEKLDVTSVDTFLSLVQNEISTHEKKLISKEKTNKQ
jgi:threonyl-tRNA synthetase